MFKTEINCADLIGEGAFRDFCAPWGFDDETVDWNDPSQYDFDSETIFLSVEDAETFISKCEMISQMMIDTLNMNGFLEDTELYDNVDRWLEEMKLLAQS